MRLRGLWDPFGKYMKNTEGFLSKADLIISSDVVVLQHLLYDLHMGPKQDTATPHYPWLDHWIQLSNPYYLAPFL